MLGAKSHETEVVMMTLKNLKIIFYKILFLSTIAVLFWKKQPTASSYTNRLMKILYCVDGDTCLAQTNFSFKLKIRLLGVDAPEIDHRPGGQQNQAFGLESKNYINHQLKGQKVWVDAYSYDIYGRTLAILRTFETKTNFNERLVREGMALAYKNPRYKTFDWALEAENFARKNKKGLWSLAPGLIPDPQKFRHSKRGFN